MIIYLIVIIIEAFRY